MSRRRALHVLGGEVVSPPPVWLMRQAGRYLPEYRETRAKAGSFLELCYNPELACEVTLQPIRRFGFDASILFSDILVVPHALGQQVWFVEGEGPRLAPIGNREDFSRLREPDDPEVWAHLAPVFETVSRIRAGLPDETTLLGFCGGPWTVASYMIGGRGTSDLAPARALADREPLLVDALIQRLVSVQTDYLIRQLRAGADAVQIFESHAGVVPGPQRGYDEAALTKWCLEPISQIVASIRREIPDAKIIVFARGSGVAGHQLAARQTGGDAIGVDWSVDLASLRGHLPAATPTQGNLHPDILVEGGHAMDAAIDKILAATEGKPHLFNLGHGILPHTPIAHVERMLARVRRSIS